MSTFKSYTLLVLLTTASLALVASSRSVADDDGAVGRWSARDVREGDEAGWSAATGDNVAEREAIVEGLLGIARDSTRGDFVRGGAILQLGAVPTAQGLRFCAEHVSESFDDFPSSSRLFHRYFPCRQALIEAGWAGVPLCLARLSGAEIAEDDVKNLAFVLRKVCGPSGATALVGSLERAGEEQALRIRRAQQYIQTYEPPMHIPPLPPPVGRPGGVDKDVPR